VNIFLTILLKKEKIKINYMEQDKTSQSQRMLIPKDKLTNHFLAKEGTTTTGLD